MTNSNLNKTRKHTREKVAERFNKRITRLNKMLDKARELIIRCEDDLNAHVPIISEVSRQSFIPADLLQYMADDIRSLIRQVEEERNRIDDRIAYANDEVRLKFLKAYANHQLDGYDWEIINLRKVIKAFKNSYKDGIKARNKLLYDRHVRYDD